MWFRLNGCGCGCGCAGLSACSSPSARRRGGASSGPSRGPVIMQCQHNGARAHGEQQRAPRRSLRGPCLVACAGTRGSAVADGGARICNAPIPGIVRAPVAGGCHPRHRAIAGHHAADGNRVRAAWRACLLNAAGVPHGAGEGPAATRASPRRIRPRRPAPARRRTAPLRPTATGVRRLPRRRLLRPALLGVLRAGSGRVRAVLKHRMRRSARTAAPRAPAAPPASPAPACAARACERQLWPKHTTPHGLTGGGNATTGCLPCSSLPWISSCARPVSPVARV
jgi:hypothetical protein